MLKAFFDRFEDIQHYCLVATALKKTIEIQDKIDTAYKKVEEDLLPPIQKSSAVD